MKKLETKLNTYLADQMVAYVKIHNLHWYVKGAGFFTLHAKFEELYDETAQVIDDVAERILALGLNPVASLKGALEIATIKELDDKAISSEASIKGLQKDIEYFAKASQEIIELAEEAGDVGTADLFTGYLINYQKTLWMLNSYLA